VHDRRVAKHRPTLNERRSSGAEQTSRTVQTSGRRPTAEPEKPRVSEDLIRLACLWQAGALSDAEFEAAKARVLAAYWRHQSSA
jgi:hypothetical protein